MLRLRDDRKATMTTEPTDGAMPLRGEHDIVMSRQTVRKLTQQLKFSLVDQTKMITAASELSRNTVVYGGGGEMRWEIVTQGHHAPACGSPSRTRAPASPTSTWR